MSKAMNRLAAATRRLKDGGGIADAVAGRLLLDHGVGAVRRGDQGGAVGRDQTALDGAARFHQLGADHDVDLAGHRHQRKHRTQPGRRILRRRQGLDIVDRRAGALRDARHRGRLRGPALALAQRDDPVGQHAAALAAHRQDRDRQRLAPCRARIDGIGGRGDVHRSVRRFTRRRMRRRARRRCSQPITAARSRARNGPSRSDCG